MREEGNGIPGHVASLSQTADSLKICSVLSLLEPSDKRIDLVLPHYDLPVFKYQLFQGLSRLQPKYFMRIYLAQAARTV